jgi:putative CocE/NonD family hydrolase
MNPASATARRYLTDLDIEIPLRDGVAVRAMTFRPDIDRPVPVLLMRTPYPWVGAILDVDLIDVSRRGIALVVQSIRGTGDSRGTFEPWLDDREDGEDVIEWCATQPWSSGRVATLGRSYPAHTQLYAAGAAPSALAAMSLGVCQSDPYDVTYTCGALNLGSALGWALGMAGMQLAGGESAGEHLSADRVAWVKAMADFDALCRSDALADIPALQRAFPTWRDWVEHNARDDYWVRRAVPDRPATPSIWVAGWFDMFLTATIAEHAREPRHPDSPLIIGPWWHGTMGSALGDVDYGSAASGIASGVGPITLDFLQAHLEGRPSGLPGVRYFMMGANEWRIAETWPPADVTRQDLFLQAGGSLVLSPPEGDESPSTFTFDPLDPVPTLGGRNLLPQADAAGATGQVNQRPLDGWPDVLRFVGEPLVDPIEIVGPLSVTLFAATSAVDTDWTAKLIDVHPDGTALNVVDGIVRARLRDPAKGERLLPADSPHEFCIDLGPTALLVKEGHRIRLDISSSNFPRFDRNPGTGKSAAVTPAAEFIVAHQTVFHDASHPSRLTLSVLHQTSEGEK